MLIPSTVSSCFAQSAKTGFDGIDGLVMAGYQGWFNTPDDGGGLGWKHYQKGRGFSPGCCTIDLWPDVSEYEKSYDTAFRYEDGTTAKVFSSRDRSTTMLHFKWMKEYGIDGVFVQRFISSISTDKGRDNCNVILENAIDAAQSYDRAICVMYDLSGISAGGENILIEDWKNLMHERNITSRSSNNYLFHNGKPLVAVWGVGFDDNRKYGYDEVEKIIDFLQSEGCSILLGVPTRWRLLKGDAMSDPRLHDLIRRADIVQPWLVGRFDNETYADFFDLIRGDVAWCKSNKIDYLPVVFPGFSWYNLKDATSPQNKIPRIGGAFFWNQIYHSISFGAKSLYVAMFDEIDEGTAIFKCANTVPVGASPFLSYEGVPSDRYLWLAGQAAKALRGEVKLTEQMPVQPSK